MGGRDEAHVAFAWGDGAKQIVSSDERDEGRCGETTASTCFGLRRFLLRGANHRGVGRGAAGFWWAWIGACRDPRSVEREGQALGGQAWRIANRETRDSAEETAFAGLLRYRRFTMKLRSNRSVVGVHTVWLSGRASSGISACFANAYRATLCTGGRRQRYVAEVA